MQEARDMALHAAQALRAAGHCVYYVGGAVRDRLLGLPVDDYDLATDAPPARLLELFPGALEVGVHFGVVILRQDDAELQIATFRSDHAYRDGRRPEGVSYETDPRRDAERRDFTINALFEDPFTGEILDFTGGRADLAARRLRAIGDPAARFAEDHLRLLRAVRFAARLQFEIDPATWDALRAAAPAIRGAAAERVRDELERILTEGGARRGFELLDASGLLAEVLPEVARLKGVAQPPQFHPEGDVWVHTLLLLEGLREPPPTLAWAALLHDIGKPGTFRVAERIRFDGHDELGAAMTGEVLTRLRCSGERIARVVELVRHHQRWRHVPQMKESTLKRFFRLPHFDEHLELHRLDCLASHGHLETYDYARRKLSELTPDVLRPAPLVNGNHLIALGYKPGPPFKRALHAIEDAQLEGRIHTREEALALAREMLE